MRCTALTREQDESDLDFLHMLPPERHEFQSLRPLHRNIRRLYNPTRRRLKHGVFRSVDDLKTAITRFIKNHNEGEAKPFTWRANPDEIIAARNRGFQL